MGYYAMVPAAIVAGLLLLKGRDGERHVSYDISEGKTATNSRKKRCRKTLIYS